MPLNLKKSPMYTVVHSNALHTNCWKELLISIPKALPAHQYSSVGLKM